MAYIPFSVIINPADTAINRLSSLQLTPVATGGQMTAWWWKPSAVLSCATCEAPTVVPPHTTQVELKARNEFFCTDTAFAVIRTHSQEGVYLPTAFTPNGDGKNDVFYVMAGAEVSTVKSFSVYNRWGQQVFSISNFAANSPQYGWRGKVGGKDAPVEVYVYYVLVTLKSGKEKMVKGTVALIR